MLARRALASASWRLAAATRLQSSRSLPCQWGLAALTHGRLSVIAGGALAQTGAKQDGAQALQQGVLLCYQCTPRNGLDRVGLHTEASNGVMGGAHHPCARQVGMAKDAACAQVLPSVPRC